MIDPSTEFGKRAARRLHEDVIAWLTTVARDGTPQPVPVWFLWDGAGSILLYSRPGTPKLANIERNPRVSLHLDGDGRGGDVVVVLGEASVSDDPPADRVPQYVAKYEWGLERNRWTAEEFSRLYSVPLRIRIRRIRGH